MLLRIKRIGIGYYELENGELIDKKLYDLCEFLEEQKQKLEKMIGYGGNK